MNRTCRATVSPVAVFVAAVVIAAIALAAVGTFFFRNVAKRADDRKSENESAREMLGQVKGVIDGGKLGETPKFPDTPVGRIQRISFEWLREQQLETEAFLKKLEDLHWSWVGTPDSLKTKENLENCLATTAQAKELVRGHIVALDSGVAAMLKKVNDESVSSPASREYVAGFRHSTQDKEGGFQIGRQTWVVLIQNMEALEEMLRYLLARSGHYRINAEGAVEFDGSITEKEAGDYNAIADRVDGFLQEINRLEAKRTALVRSQLEKADSLMQKP